MRLPERGIAPHLREELQRGKYTANISFRLSAMTQYCPYCFSYAVRLLYDPCCDITDNNSTMMLLHGEQLLKRRGRSRCTHLKQQMLLLFNLPNSNVLQRSQGESAHIFTDTREGLTLKVAARAKQSTRASAARRKRR